MDDQRENRQSSTEGWTAETSAESDPADVSMRTAGDRETVEQQEQPDERREASGAEPEDLKDGSDLEEVGRSRRPMAMGIETDKFDLPPEVDRDPATEAELEGKDGVLVGYSFNGEDIREGLKVFQKATIYKRNLIFTLLLVAMFAIYSVNIANDPGNMFSTVLAVVCVAVTVMIWYLPAKHIKATAESADANEMQFHMTVYDDCVRIAEQDNGSFVIHFGKEVSRSFETANLFMVCVGKERIFILPKRYLEGEQTEKIRSFLKQGMLDKHFDKRR